LVKNKKILCFDLDNVICKTKNNNYLKSTPNKKIISLINALYRTNRYTIKIYTARGMGIYKGNLKLVKQKLQKLTLYQLKKWKLTYHELIMGKISYDIFVDDKCFGFKENWYIEFKEKYLNKNEKS
jgi:hypothetical protein